MNICDMGITDPPNSKEYTFSEYIPVFISEKSMIISPVTLENYKRELKRGEKYLGSEKLGNIDFLMMKQYFRFIRENEKNERTGSLLAIRTIRQHYVILHSFFENAFENELIGENPMKRLKRPIERKDDILKAPLSYDEEKVRYIIKCLDNEPLMWRTVIIFAIDSGCRCGEIMGLKWSEIDFDSGQVYICRNIQYTPGIGTIVCTPKNRKNRVIYINRPALDCLRKWKSIQQEEKKKYGCGYCDEGYCFTQKNGKALIPASFNNYLKMFGKKYGLPGIHPHALRHTMASLSITNGADIVSVSKKLGHSSASVTLDVYSHENIKSQLLANAVLAKAIYE